DPNTSQTAQVTITGASNAITVASGDLNLFKATATGGSATFTATSGNINILASASPTTAISVTTGDLILRTDNLSTGVVNFGSNSNILISSLSVPSNVANLATAGGRLV